MHIVSYVYIYRHAQVHVLSMYNVCSVYIYIYICIRLNYIIYIDSEYLHYTYNTIYNTQCTVHSTEYTKCNTQYAMCKTRHHIKYVLSDDIAMILGYSAPILG